jgi:myo-inositol-1(or 4)-monophosphatase
MNVATPNLIGPSYSTPAATTSGAARLCQAGPVTADAGDLRAEHDLAVSLARDAGLLQVRERRGVLENAGRITSKAHANDLVSDVDVASEALIVDGLRAAFPDDGVLGEEGGGVAGTSGRRWVVDPLDGTRNYLSGAGPWSVSIALQTDGELVVGVVHDPVVGETFSAVAGGGCRLDDVPVSASPVVRLNEALAGLSFQPSLAVKGFMGPVVADLLPLVGDIRRIPAALHLAYLACGRFDCGLLVAANLWDVAAGLVLAREAGVVLGEPDDRSSPAVILAAAPGLWREFVACDAAKRVGRDG